MMKIEKIWEELESEKSLKSGLLYKRSSGTVKPDLYVAIKYPEGFRCIAAHLEFSDELEVKNWDRLKDLKIESVLDEQFHNKQFLLVILLNNQHKDIFTTLCEDLIKQVSDLTEKKELIKILMLRLEKWRLLFEKLGQQGLSEEAQQGLFGELYFLRKFMKNHKNVESCINSWKGPEKATQDFQFADWAVEIKTTHGKNQQKIHISSERQLDISIIPNIFLIHYSLEIRQKHGESLNNVVENILEILSEKLPSYNLFQLKLLEAGYFNFHHHFYEEKCYSIRQENIYKVTKNFPKIVESDIQAGVGDVSYSVILTSNIEWDSNEEELFMNIIKDA